MVELNMVEEFHARRMAECKHTAYFAMRCEMARDEYKEKREEKRARKQEKAQRAKEAYARGGERVLMRGKWSRLTSSPIHKLTNSPHHNHMFTNSPHHFTSSQRQMSTIQHLNTS
jgi:acetyl-CoA acetyltransferase